MSDRDRPLVIAHRGASADVPENTVEAFLVARAQGADWVELDVRLAADGALIVHHDAWYRDQRTVWSTARNEVPDGTIELATALAACDGMGVNVEIKNSPGDLADAPGGPAVVEATMAALATVDLGGDRILVSSFDLASIELVKEIDPAAATAYLVLDLSAEPDAVAIVADGGHQALHPWDPFVTAELLETCHGRGVRLNTWTVNDAQRWGELVRLGVDGIVTDTPGLLAAALS